MLIRKSLLRRQNDQYNSNKNRYIYIINCNYSYVGNILNLYSCHYCNGTLIKTRVLSVDNMKPPLKLFNGY